MTDYPLGCCRCKKDVTLTQSELDEHERESKVVLCTYCTGEDRILVITAGTIVSYYDREQKSGFGYKRVAALIGDKVVWNRDTGVELPKQFYDWIETHAQGAAS